MNADQRVMFHAALAVYEGLCDQIPQYAEPLLPHATWNECQRLVRLSAKAKRRGWIATAGQTEARLLLAATECSRHLDLLRGQLNRGRASQPTASPRDIYHDLIALGQEFRGVTIQRRATTIAVETDDVVLEELSLGQYQIVLDWSRLGASQPYEVISLDATAAASSSETCHPHVQDGKLCEGDGHTALQSSLRQGRLFDFFVLVRQILATYNSSSAYVSLENWYGINCSDCGRLTDEDERDCCERCGTDMCCDCSLGCAGCSDRCCTDCTHKCQGCDDDHCTGCLTDCAGCNEPFCQECLTDDKCKTCCENEEEGEEPETISQITPQAATPLDSSAPVQSLCVGEAAVSP